MLIWLNNQRKVQYRTFQLRFSEGARLEALEHYLVAFSAGVVSEDAVAGLLDKCVSVETAAAKAHLWNILPVMQAALADRPALKGLVNKVRNSVLGPTSG